MKTLTNTHWFNSAFETVIHFNKKAEYSTQLTCNIGKLWQRLIHSLVANAELRIWKTGDRHGETWWHAYDPVTHRKFCCTSEAEMRIWIEQRYYMR